MFRPAFQQTERGNFFFLTFFGAEGIIFSWTLIRSDNFIRKTPFSKSTSPASKSLLNRALILAAFGNGEVFLACGSFAEDTRSLLGCLSALGIRVQEESGGLRVIGCGGNIPNRRAELYVGSAGTAARFLTAALAFLGGEYHMRSSAQMEQRPMELLAVLEEAGHLRRIRKAIKAFPLYPALRRPSEGFSHRQYRSEYAVRERNFARCRRKPPRNALPDGKPYARELYRHDARHAARLRRTLDKRGKHPLHCARTALSRPHGDRGRPLGRLLFLRPGTALFDKSARQTHPRRHPAGRSEIPHTSRRPRRQIYRFRKRPVRRRQQNPAPTRVFARI